MRQQKYKLFWQNCKLLSKQSSSIRQSFIPVIRQYSIAYSSYNFVPYFPHTNLYIESSNFRYWSIRLKKMSKNWNTHLNFIKGTSLRVSIPVNNNSVVTFVYKVSTSTDVVQIWSIPIPVLQLMWKSS